MRVNRIKSVNERKVWKIVTDRGFLLLAIFSVCYLNISHILPHLSVISVIIVHGGGLISVQYICLFIFNHSR